MDAPQGAAGSAPGTDDVASPPTELAVLQRLWTPWRMRYVGGGAAEAGCLFCNRLSAGDDVRSLILHRGERAFAIMNRFPYNTGHLMLVPNEHVPSPEEADLETLAELAMLLSPTVRALRRALACDGFNVGMNVGAVAGAGVADHVHQHVVPRWQGDANFMPILAATMVLPELIPITYAKLRAELARELGRSAADGRPPVDVTCVVLTRDHARVLVVGDGNLPTATADRDEPLWRAAARAVDDLVADGAELVGWAGSAMAEPGDVRLTFRALSAAPKLRPRPAGGQPRWIEVGEASIESGTAPDLRAVQWALANLAPSVAGP